MNKVDNNVDKVSNKINKKVLVILFIMIVIIVKLYIDKKLPILYKSLSDNTNLDNKKDSKNTKLDNNDILYENIIIGGINGDSIDVINNKKNYIFSGVLDNTKFIHHPFISNTFVYDDLVIYFPFDNSSIDFDYKCNGQVIGNSIEGKTEYKNCKTNNKDYLTEYKFGITFREDYLNGVQDYLGWYKVYVKKIGGENIVFEAPVLDGYYSNEESEYNSSIAFRIYNKLLKLHLVNDLGIKGTDIDNLLTKDSRVEITSKISIDLYNKMQKIMRSEKYLNLLIKENIKREVLLDKVVNSFSIK